MKKSLYISILATMLSLLGCREMGAGTSSEMFARDATTYGVWLGGRQVLVKTDNLHQESRRGKSYRIQTDDQSIYINILLNTVPVLVGDKCTATITSRGLSGVTDMAIDMVLQKTQDDMMWLWNESDRMGVVIPILN